MIRWCIQCKEIFGCQGFDGKKWTCDGCDYRGSCDTKDMADPPAQDTTGGICNWCFEKIKIAKHALRMKNRLLTAGHGTPSQEVGALSMVV